MVRDDTFNILYLAHDLSDAAVIKRVIMLQDGGATVSPAGFRRTAELVENVAGHNAVNFGQTFNGGFIQRLLLVLKTLCKLKQHKALFESADLILARNLEMLAIAVRGRSLCSKKPVIVYECLDIHRLLLGRGVASRMLRDLEGWLSKKASALLTSSPAFISGYFKSLSKVNLPIRLVENKVYPFTSFVENAPRANGPVWKIGWFGAIRCRKSLDILSNLVKQHPGKIEVTIRGRPALDQFDDFHKIVSETPDITFLGAYKNPDDLAAIYREVHFSWAIDMFEEGLNSSWLLPNRLYEGGLYGAVPLALCDVETGKTAKRLGIGAILIQPLGQSLETFFATLTPDKYRALEQAVLKKPVDTWLFTKQDCTELVDYLKHVH